MGFKSANYNNINIKCICWQANDKRIVFGWHLKMVISMQSTHSDKKLASDGVIEKVAVSEMWHLAGGSTEGARVSFLFNQIFACAEKFKHLL